MKTFLCLLILACLCSAAYAEDIAASGETPVADYYTDSAKMGWWWGKYTPPEEKKKEKKDEKTKDKPQAQSAPVLEKRPGIEELKKMPARDLREYFDKVQDTAVGNPTEDNVLWFYTVQDVIRRRSTAFMNTAQYVMQKYPELNTETDYPITTPGVNARARQTMDEVEAVIRSAQNDFALLYFYSPTCPYCEAQDGILKFFVSKYGWQIQPEELASNRNLAVSLGVNSTPSLVLIKNGNKDFLLVSAGVLAMSDIEDRIYRGVRLLNGEIKPEEYSGYGFQKGGTFDVNAPFKDTRIGH